MQRIDENTYIDDTLVTCAEYQLFIDEMRERGKYYQPDHWASYRFPVGDARKPILGMRLSDTYTFCEWLTQRDIATWRYRLPFYEEALNYPIESLPQLPLGYWVINADKQSQFFWVGSVPSDARGVDRDFGIDIRSDLEQAFSRAHVRGLTCDSLIGRDLDLALDLAQNRVHNIAPARRVTSIIAAVFIFTRHTARDLDHALTRIRDRVLDFDHDFALALNRDLGFEIDYSHTFEIDDDLNLAYSIDRDLDLTLARSRALTLARDLIRTRDAALAITHDLHHDIAQALGHVLDLFVDILTMQERIIGRSPTFEGIRLVKERK